MGFDRKDVKIFGGIFLMVTGFFTVFGLILNIEKRNHVKIKEILDNPNVQYLNPQVRNDVMNLFEKGRYSEAYELERESKKLYNQYQKDTLIEQARMIEIKTELDLLKGLMEGKKHGSAIDLIVTINGQLKEKFKIVNQDSIDTMQRELNLLRAELQASKK